MAFLRRIALIVLIVILGCATAIGVAVTIAALAAPVHPSHDVTIEIFQRPATEGKWNWAGYMWDFGEAHGFGQSTAQLITIPFEQLPKDKPVVRPVFAPEVEWFLGRTWLPAPIETDSPSLNHTFNVFLYGWPARALWYGRVGNTGFPQAAPWTQHGYGALELGRNARGPRLLPTRILWPGLILDSALFAAAWAGLFGAVHKLRLSLRKRRGQCIRCLYDLRATPASAPCPECGHKRTAR